MMRAILLVGLLALAPSAFAEDDTKAATEAEPETKAEADTKAEPGMHPRVKLETTLGDIIFELDAEKAPISVQNFMRYAQDGFYNDTIFHRVIDDFMIQGGGFTADMTRKGEGLRPPIKNEWDNGLKNVNGTIAMARTNAPHSATSQFFINVKDNPALDQPRGGAAYAVFGKVVEGTDVVEAIRTTEVHIHPKLRTRDGAVTPVEPAVIKSVTAISEYDAEKVAALAEKAIAKMEAAEKAAAKAAEEAAAKALAEQKTQKEALIKKVEEETGKKFETTESGLMHIILKEGDGPSPGPTDKVKVHYTGWLLDGSKFDSSVDRGKPFTFSLQGGVIQGWLEGVAIMKVGEKRKLVIPYELAYGERGRPPKIPPKATLVFDVELLGIEG